MSAFSNFERTYRSKNGDNWRFYYDAKIGRARITGNDIETDVYPVYEGIAKGLILEQNERKWLTNSWLELISEHGELDIYLGRKTQFLHSKKHSQLSENFCPICLTQKKQFHIHHCIESQNGGPDNSKNLLRICQSCHVALTSGGEEDKLSKGRAALWHQMAYFGVGFIPPKDSCGGRHPNVSFRALFPKASQLVERYQKCSEEERPSLNQILMEHARVEYQYYRDLGFGTNSWPEFERLFCRPDKAHI